MTSVIVEIRQNPIRFSVEDLIWALRAAWLIIPLLCRSPDDVTPHVLAHTFATWFYAPIRDFGALMDQGGWTKADMVNRYWKLAPDDLSKRLLKVGWDFRPDLPEDRRNR